MKKKRVAIITVAVLLLLGIVAAVLLTGSGPRLDIWQASEAGDIKVLEQLLADGAEVNARDSNGRAPLHHAVKSQKRETVEFLIAHGADVNLQDMGSYRGGYQRPLHIAVRPRGPGSVGATSIIELLINAGADVNAMTTSGFLHGDTPMNRNHDETVRKLLRKHGGLYGHEAHQALGEKIEKFFGAIDRRDYRAIQNQLDAGVSVNLGSRVIQNTALHTAAKEGDKKLAEFLIKNGAFINAGNFGGETPLGLAVRNGKTEIAELLIDKGVGVNGSSGMGGGSHVFHAAVYGHMDTMKMLIEKGADLNAKSGGEFTLLHRLANPIEVEGFIGDFDYLEVIELAINKGAKVNSKDGKGRTPLDWAISKKRTETVDLLRKHGGKTAAELKVGN